MPRRVDTPSMQPPPIPEDAKKTQEFDLAKLARQSELASEIIDRKDVPNTGTRYAEPLPTDGWDEVEAAAVAHVAARNKEKYRVTPESLQAMRQQQQESANRRAAEQRAAKEAQRIKDERLLEEALEALEQFPTSEEEAKRSHGETLAHGWQETTVSGIAQSLDAMDAAEELRKANQTLQPPKKKGFFAKVGGFFKNLFSRKDKFARQVEEMSTMSDAQVAAERKAQERAEQDAAHASGDALEQKLAKGQGMVSSAIEQVGNAMTHGMDTVTDTMYDDGPIPRKVEPKKTKWDRIAENDFDLMMADGAAEARRLKDEAKAEAYAAKLEAKAAKGQGMVESVVMQGAEALSHGMDTASDAVLGGRTISEERQPLTNDAKIARASADMEGMTDEDVWHDNVEVYTKDKMAEHAEGEAYATKLEAKVAKGQGMVESVVMQGAEALSHGMDTLTDFVYQGRNEQLSDEVFLEFHGEPARERLADIIKNIPAREYNALLKGVDNLDASFVDATGGEQKQQLQRLIQETPIEQINAVVDALSPENTIRDLVSQTAEKLAA